MFVFDELNPQVLQVVYCGVSQWLNVNIIMGHSQKNPPMVVQSRRRYFQYTSRIIHQVLRVETSHVEQNRLTQYSPSPPTSSRLWARITKTDPNADTLSVSEFCSKAYNVRCGMPVLRRQPQERREPQQPKAPGELTIGCSGGSNHDKHKSKSSEIRDLLCKDNSWVIMKRAMVSDIWLGNHA
jgi:hypothetical protein